MQPGDTKTISSVERSFRILEALVERDGAGVNELATELGYAPSTVHAHLATLQRLGYVLTTDGEYDISNRCLYFSQYARMRVTELDVIETNVRRLAEETDERVQFMIEEHGRGIYVTKAEGRHGAPNNTTLGNPRYLHICASGKAILAHLPSERVSEIVARWGLPTQTERTITDEETLHAELGAIREREYSTNEGETVDGLTAIGASVRSADDRVIGSISISGPTHRLATDGEIKDIYRETLLGAIEDITLNLKFK